MSWPETQKRRFPFVVGLVNTGMTDEGVGPGKSVAVQPMAFPDSWVRVNVAFGLDLDRIEVVLGYVG